MIMPEIKRLSLSNLKRIVGVTEKHNKVVRWHTDNITIKRLLTVEEYLQTVRAIIRDCKAPDGGVAIELLDFAIRLNVIISYAYIELPKQLEEIYYIIYASDLYETICAHANTAQIESIIESVMLYVERAEPTG